MKVAVVVGLGLKTASRLRAGREEGVRGEGGFERNQSLRACPLPPAHEFVTADPFVP